MKQFFTLFIKALPFTIGVILILISLAFLVDFTEQSLDLEDLGDQEFLAFIIFSLVGIPMLLFGINIASNENL